jgi:transcriptional regulator with XRE-family HTH domain
MAPLARKRTDRTEPALDATGSRIRRLRRRRALRQETVARAAGISQPTLSNYETGKREVPITTALSIAAALDVSLAELLGIQEVIMLRDSRLGLALANLASHPELLDLFDR